MEKIVRINGKGMVDIAETLIENHIMGKAMTIVSVEEWAREAEEKYRTEGVAYITIPFCVLNNPDAEDDLVHFLDETMIDTAYVGVEPIESTVTRESFQGMWEEVARLENIITVDGREIYFKDGLYARHEPTGHRVLSQFDEADYCVWMITESKDYKYESFVCKDDSMF